MLVIPNECPKCKDELTIDMPLYQWANGDVYVVCPRCDERTDLIEMEVK